MALFHIVTAEEPPIVSAGEKAIAELAFLSVEELRARREALETWSQIVIDAWETLWLAVRTGEPEPSGNSSVTQLATAKSAPVISSRGRAAFPLILPSSESPKGHPSARQLGAGSLR